MIVVDAPESRNAALHPTNVGARVLSFPASNIHMNSFQNSDVVWVDVLLRL